MTVERQRGVFRVSGEAAQFLVQPGDLEQRLPRFRIGRRFSEHSRLLSLEQPVRRCNG
jgi:hypothetical protein